MAKSADLNSREMESYVDTGNSKSIAITLGNASVETVITLPSDAKGFRIYSASDNLRFAVNETCEAVGTGSGTTVAITDFTVGAVALSGQWEQRLLPSQVGETARTISVLSLVNATVFTLELF